MGKRQLFAPHPWVEPVHRRPSGTCVRQEPWFLGARKERIKKGRGRNRAAQNQNNEYDDAGATKSLERKERGGIPPEEIAGTS